MQPKIIVTGAISFMLGGIAFFVIFARSGNNQSEVDSRRSILRSDRGDMPHRNSPRLNTRPQRLANHESLEPTEEHVDRKSLRRFLSIDPDELGDPAELVDWGFSKEEAGKISAAYSDTIEAARKMEADIVSVRVDKDGNDYLYIPAHVEESRGILSALEKRLQEACPGGSAGVLAEIVSADIFGINQYRSDELPRMIYLTRDPDGRISYHDQLISEGGEELVSQIYVSDPGDEDFPAPLAHLFKGAQWSNNRLHDNH